MSIKNIIINLFGVFTQDDLEERVENIKSIMTCTIAAKEEQIRILKSKNENLKNYIDFLQKSSKSETLVEKDIHELFKLKTDFTKIYFDGEENKALNVFVAENPVTMYIENKKGVTVTQYSNNVPKKTMTLAEAGRIISKKPCVSKMNSGNK